MRSRGPRAWVARWQAALRIARRDATRNLRRTLLIVTMIGVPIAAIVFLVSLVFLGGDINLRPLTVHIAELSGTRGSAWHVLSAGAFVSMVVPVAVFLGLQRYFVRGLLAGGLKG